MSSECQASFVPLIQASFLREISGTIPRKYAIITLLAIYEWRIDDEPVSKVA
jgi:hypothetical protein